jgi:hypothetical protein
MTSKVQSILFGFFSLLAGFVSYLAGLPPETQTGLFHEIAGIFPAQYAAHIGSFLHVVSELSALYSLYHASQVLKAGVKTAGVAALALLALLAGTGCSTSGTNATLNKLGSATNQAAVDALNILGTTDFSAIYQAASTDAKSPKGADFGNSLAYGLYANMGNIANLAQFANVAGAYSNGNTPVTASAVKTAFQNDATPENAAKVVAAIASVVSEAVNK